MIEMKNFTWKDSVTLKWWKVENYKNSNLCTNFHFLPMYTCGAYGRTVTIYIKITMVLYGSGCCIQVHHVLSSAPCLCGRDKRASRTLSLGISTAIRRRWLCACPDSATVTGFTAHVFHIYSRILNTIYGSLIILIVSRIIITILTNSCYSALYWYSLEM